MNAGSSKKKASERSRGKSFGVRVPRGPEGLLGKTTVEVAWPDYLAWLRCSKLSPRAFSKAVSAIALEAAQAPCRCVMLSRAVRAALKAKFGNASQV